MSLSQRLRKPPNRCIINTKFGGFAISINNINNRTRYTNSGKRSRCPKYVHRNTQIAMPNRLYLFCIRQHFYSGRFNIFLSCFSHRCRIVSSSTLYSPSFCTVISVLNCFGLTPSNRLNARLNTAALLNPTAAATYSMVFCSSNSHSFAFSILHLIM